MDSLVGDTLQLHSFPKRLTPKTNNLRKPEENLQDYPFLPLEEAPLSLKANLAPPTLPITDENLQRGVIQASHLLVFGKACGQDDPPDKSFIKPEVKYLNSR